MRKALDIPSMVSDMMAGYLKGQAKVNLDLRASDDLAFLLRRLVRNIVMGLWVMALLISFKYYLYDRYESENTRHSGAWGDRIYSCVFDRTIRIYQTYFFEKIKSGTK